VATLVARVRVVEAAAVPLGVTVAGENEQVLYAGKPVHAKLTWLLKPPDGVMVMAVVAVLPWATLPLAGLSEMLKSAGTEAVTVTVTAEEVEAAKFAFPPYAAVIECVPTARLLVE
jgi:hypothetical protein